MNKKLLLFITMFFTLQIFPQEYTDWKWLHPKPQGQPLRWAQMLDDNNWFAGGMHGSFIKTTNAGETWYHHAKSSHPYSDGDYNQNYIGHFFDANIGINGGGDAIMRTTDGGITWGRINYSFSTFGIIWGSYFRGNIGYVSGDDSIMIHKTTNAGRNWRKIIVPMTRDEILWDVWSPDDDLIIACTHGGNIYRSSDRGATFTKINVGHTRINYNMAFKDQNTGFVVGQGGNASYTTDGGLTWTRVSGLPSYNMNDVDFKRINGVDQFIVSGSPYVMYSTSNMGDSWNQIKFRPTSQRWSDYYFASDFLSDGSFLTVGEAGLMNSRIGTGTPKLHTEFLKMGEFYDVWSDKPYGKVIAVGDESFSGADDHVFVSTNGGQTWSPKDVNSDASFRSISMVNSDVGYIAGTEGALFKTTNGGSTWQSSTTNISTHLYRVDFISETTGWAVGQSGVLIKTTNGGQTWVNQNSRLPASIYGVDFVNENVGWITGAKGYVNKTTDGGATWILQNALLDSAIGFSIKAVNDMVVYVVGTRSKISKTTDGGETWNILQPPAHFSTVNIYDVDFKDENFGVLCATSSKVLTTTDGGTTWKLEFANNVDALGIDIADSTTKGISIYVVGRKASVLANNLYTTPVELSAFTAQINEDGVLLNWITATEKNNSGFAIERSKPNNPFEQISYIEGSGTTSTVNNYSFLDKSVSSGRYIYRLKQIDFDGTASFSNEIEVDINSIPSKFSLSQNYPNPFNPSTVIKYSIPVQEKVIIKIFDLLGKEVTTLVNEVKPIGKYEVTWNAENLSSGLYFYQIRAGKFIETKKMMLMK